MFFFCACCCIAVFFPHRTQVAGGLASGQHADNPQTKLIQSSIQDCDHNERIFLDMAILHKSQTIIIMTFTDGKQGDLDESNDNSALHLHISNTFCDFHHQMNMFMN